MVQKGQSLDAKSPRGAVCSYCRVFDKVSSMFNGSVHVGWQACFLP